MNNGEKIQALMLERGWNYADVARAVRAQGAKTVKYQHIQQLVLFPDRAPRYILELAAAFGMTAEQFKHWKPGRSADSPADEKGVRESASPAYVEPKREVDFAAEVRELSLAMVLVADWIRETRPMEAPALLEALQQGRKEIGGTEEHSTLALMEEALHPTKAEGSTHAARKFVKRRLAT
jgi:hypothetical protein